MLRSPFLPAGHVSPGHSMTVNIRRPVRLILLYFESHTNLNTAIQSKEQPGMQTHANGCERMQTHATAYDRMPPHTTVYHRIRSYTIVSHGIPRHPVASRGIPRHPTASRGIRLRASSLTRFCKRHIIVVSCNIDPYSWRKACQQATRKCTRTRRRRSI